MGNDRTGLTKRIISAEDWLDRARREIEDGDLDRGALTLILAEAEVHLAREVSMAAPASPAHRKARFGLAGAALGIVAAVLGVVIMAAVGQRFGAPMAARDEAPLAVVRLPDGTGEILRMVVAPEPAVERTVEKRVIMRVPVPVVAANREALPASPAVVPVSAAPQVVLVPHPAAPAPAPAPAVAPVAPAAATAPVVAPAPALLNEADVIDLVLAAERSLRRPSKQ
jgi:hypothetical protein